MALLLPFPLQPPYGDFLLLVFKMRFGLYPSILSISRLSSPPFHQYIRKISSMERSTQINPASSCNDSSRTQAGETGQSVKQPDSLKMSGLVKGKNQPLFSVRPTRKGKRRTKIDLEESMSGPIIDREVKEDDDFSLPTSFGKKRVPFASRVVTKDSCLVKASNTEKPFDICLSSNRKLTKLKPALDYNYDGEENGLVLRPGMVLLKNYLQLHEQVDIVKKCRELGLGNGGFYQPSFKHGGKLRLHMMCLGKDWDPQTKRYGETRQYDNSNPPDIPPSFHSLVENALQSSYSLIRKDLERNDVEDILPGISPDICIINFYTIDGRLGLHQDRDESKESLNKGLPVVSVSIGDSAEFLYGDERDVEKAERVMLESGDVLIFGGESRHIYHGVSSILQNTAPRHLIKSTKLRPGRLNLTFRQF